VGGVGGQNVYTELLVDNGVSTLKANMIFLARLPSSADQNFVSRCPCRVRK
jgi:hypothetical protein